MGMLIFSLGIGVAAFGLWPAHSHGTTLIGAFSGLVLALAVGALFLRVTAMPRPMSAIPGQTLDGHPRPLVARNDELLLITERELVAVGLPSGRITSRLVLKPAGFRAVLSVVSARGAVIVSFHRGPETNGWAFIPADRRRIDLHERSFPDWRTLPEHRYRPAPHAYWDDARDRFVLVEIEHPARIGGDCGLTLTPIDIAGRAGKAERFRVKESELPVEAKLCAIGDQLYATGYRHACVLGSESDGLRSCVEQPVRAACPGTLEGEPVDWLGVSAPVPYPRLPEAFAKSVPADRQLVLGPGGMTPAASWTTETLATIHSLSDKLVQIENVSEDESARLGQMREKHALIELLDARGTPLAQARLFRPPTIELVAPSGNQIVLLAAELDEIARFDRTTLERLDQPSESPALVRLRISGGRSPVTAIALCAVPVGAGALLLALLSFWLLPRIRQTERAWTILRRTSALFAVLAFAVLIVMAQRIWYGG